MEMLLADTRDGAVESVRGALHRLPIRWRCLIAAGCLFAALASGQTSPRRPTSRDISELAPEELMNLQVTPAGNKNEVLSRVRAALYVITREDIQSSGANTIPDLLRLVPGVEVARRF